MKRFKSTLFAAATALVASFTMVSCNQPTPTPPPPPLPDITNATVMPHVAAIYTGDQLNVGLAHFSTIFYSDGLTFNENNFYLEGTGDIVALDFLTDMPADERELEIAAGVYFADDLEYNLNRFTFARGVMDETGETNGSFIATVVDGKEKQDPIVEGTMWVNRTGDTYQFVIQVKTELGQEKLYKFENTIKFINFGVPVPPYPFEGKFITADYQYYGDYYEVNFGNSMMELTTIPAGRYVAGYVLGLDINNALVASQKEIKVKAGTYHIDDSETFNAPMTFNAGFGESQGSYWLAINSEGGIISGYPIVDGEFTITDIGSGKHKVVASFQAGGQTFDATFEGVIPVDDASCLSRMEGDIALNNFTQGAMVYRGNIEYTTNGAENWGIFLATAGIDLETMKGTGDIMQLDINTAKGAKLEPSLGRYSVVKAINNELLVPMTYIPGYFDNLRQGLIGTWYRQDSLGSRPTAPGVTGSIEIAKNEANTEYTVTFDMHDDYYYVNAGLGNKITGSYSGKLTYIDATANIGTSAPAFAPFSVAPRTEIKAVVAGKRDFKYVDSSRRVIRRR